ncbi:penicillin acylase family protein, partial [Caulobacter sp. HMWF009]
MGVFSKLAWIAVLGSLALPAHAADNLTRLKARAAGIEITRDTWGIAHIHGKTDADAVFGMAYAQAEDD